MYLNRAALFARSDVYPLPLFTFQSHASLEQRKEHISSGFSSVRQVDTWNSYVSFFSSRCPICFRWNSKEVESCLSREVAWLYVTN